MRDWRLTRTRRGMDSRWFLAGVILNRTASSKLHNSLPLFRWRFQPKTYPMGDGATEANHFHSGYNKRRPTDIVNLLFIMKLVILSTRDKDIELVVMNIAMGYETMHNGATIQHILNESTKLQGWFHTLHREFRCSVISVNKQHA